MKSEIQVKEYRTPVRKRLFELRKNNLITSSDIQPKLPMINTPPSSTHRLFDNNERVKKMFERRQERLRLLSDYQDDDDSDIEEMINEATEAA